MTTWGEQEKVDEYLARVDRLEARRAGEAALVETFPDRVERVLDLGCGDGRLIALVLGARPGVADAFGLDRSEPMREEAQARFTDDPRVTILDHDLRTELPRLGTFDLVVSGFAIHHLEDDRKRSLLTEVVAALRPDGLFANLEVVRCATPELDAEFKPPDRAPQWRPGGPAGPRRAPARVDAGSRARPGRLLLALARLRPVRRTAHRLGRSHTMTLRFRVVHPRDPEVSDVLGSYLRAVSAAIPGAVVSETALNDVDGFVEPHGRFRSSPSTSGPSAEVLCGSSTTTPPS